MLYLNSTPLLRPLFDVLNLRVNFHYEIIQLEADKMPQIIISTCFGSQIFSKMFISVHSLSYLQN